MKRKLFTVIALLFVVFVTLACGSSSGVEVNTPSSDDAASTEAPVAAQPGTARSNPAPVGSEVVVDDMAFQILSIVKPADSIVASGNMFNSTPEPDQEYMFVEVQVTCKKSMDDKCIFSPELSTSVIGSKGIDYDAVVFLAGVEKTLSSTEFYGGAVISGYLPFIVGKEETGFVLVYEPLLGDKFYLAIPE